MLKDYYYDLFILVGDYAYEMENNDGVFGD